MNWSLVDWRLDARARAWTRLAMTLYQQRGTPIIDAATESRQRIEQMTDDQVAALLADLPGEEED